MTKSLIVRGGRIELESELGGKPMVSVYPAKGPETYVNVAQEIINAGLALPRGPETASLVGAAFSDLSNRYSKEIKQTMDNRWLWVFTRDLYMPEKGVYLYDSVDKFDESELVKRLEAKDKSVRFVPFGFKAGEQTAPDLAKNAYVVAQFGEEGAEKLAKASEKYSRNPKVWTLSADDVREPIQGVSCLGGYCDGCRLLVDGDYFVGDDGGYAFGVSPSADEGSASAPKK
ncbi:MAG: hypothetical protein Q8L27_03180 [archaeon]|nr:hypothetical protein [archaeon]